MEVFRKKRARRVVLQFLLLMLFVGVLGTTVSEAGGVVLAWDPSSDPQVVGYNVYRSESRGTFVVSALNGSSLVYDTTFVDTTGEWNRNYYYVVTAVNALGLESVPTNAVEAGSWLSASSSGSQAIGVEAPPAPPTTNSPPPPSTNSVPVQTSNGDVVNWVSGDGQRWFSVNGVSHVWGYDFDVPVCGDFDGDGQADIAVYRPPEGTWWILTSSSGFSDYIGRQWGISSDVPTPGDYDSDGRTDIAVFRPSEGIWYVLTSGSGFSSYLLL